ncbi:antitoxin Xre-like helix-turn-helix domain-containing protein [Parvibaculum sp.]|uniref:type II RES/Xre toxin-antitoxin system antitoxin n=1 Tax=Parvibaculum sp. TaxID=2024848 RepID=UPI00349FFC02
MAEIAGTSLHDAEPTEQQRAADLLGGARVLRRAIRTPLDAHEVIRRGLPAQALTRLVGRLTVLGMTDGRLERALGMSLRTYQRRKDVPAGRLSVEQSGRTWKFAEILAKATDLLGSQPEAEQWLERPAMGLDRQRPIDLLETPAGVEMVEDFLTQLEYGVYV